MGNKEKISDVGVVVGRFQIPELHKGHKDLIDFVLSRHDKVCIILGVPRTRSTPRNPMDFHTRYMMIKDSYKDSNNLTISSIVDVNDDKIWSEKLDEKLDEMYHGKSITLYGSRDSFIQHYTGVNDTQELESEVFISGSMIRDNLKDKVISTPEFRAGIIYSANDRFFNAIPTVDVAIINAREKDDLKLLLGRKRYEDKYRLIGGFVDSTDDSLEAAARRELREEAGINLEVSEMNYVTSEKIDDWRYKREKSKIITTLFKAFYMWGSPQPGEDIYELKWFNMSKIKKSDIMEPHHNLVKKILNSFDRTYKK